MKSYIKTFMLLIMWLVSDSAMAGNPTKYFEKIASKSNYDYSFVSPVMLKAMGDRTLSAESYGSLPVKTSDLSSIETISTAINGQDEDLWKIIREIKNSKKMETLSTKKQNYYRYDVLARLSGDGKFITNLMVVTQNGGQAVNVVYMEGKIPIDSLKYALAD